MLTCWFPPELVFGTDLDKDAVLPVGLRDHLRTVKGLRVDHISERLTARRPAGDEARLLEIGEAEPVLSMLAGVHDASDLVRFVVEVVMPGALHELEDFYSVPD